ncbi:MAG: Imm52 family immunity protein [Methylovirgula sp.]
MTPGLDYYTGVFWGPRQETPAALAARWIKLIARLQAVDPTFAHWYTWTNIDSPVVPFCAEIKPLAEEIASRVNTNDDGTPQPLNGYQWLARNTADVNWGPRYFSAHMCAGSPSKWGSNTIGMGTDYGVVPDPDVVTYKIFRGALLALAETFEATIGSAYPTSLIDLWPKENRRGQLTLKFAWISYVAPLFAPLITPPASAIVERRPDGGLLMAATDETFVSTNPVHLAVAREIEAAVAPFNALPYPWGETPT